MGFCRIDSVSNNHHKGGFQMAIKTRPEPRTEDEEPIKQRNPLTDKVAENVLALLGKPKGLLKIKAIHLFENRFRVNVYEKVYQEFEGLIKKLYISESFFCIADEKGGIISPEIEKKY
jgi:hypothetical protein